MKEGRRSFSVMDLNEQHPLLEFANEYGLDDLKVTYGEAMMCQNPVTLQNASLYLELGLRFFRRQSLSGCSGFAGSQRGEGPLARRCWRWMAAASRQFWPVMR